MEINRFFLFFCAFREKPFLDRFSSDDFPGNVRSGNQRAPRYHLHVANAVLERKECSGLTHVRCSSFTETNLTYP